MPGSVAFSAEPDEVIAADAQSCGGVGGVAADDREPAARVDNQTPLPFGEVGVGRDALGDGVAGVGVNRDAISLVETGGCEVGIAYVELHVAEAVEVEYFARDLAGLDRRFRNAEFDERLGLYWFAAR